MQILVQDGLPSYSWEDLHLFLWFKPSPPLFFFFVNHKKQVALWAEGQVWVGSYQCFFSTPWSRILPVDGDRAAPTVVLLTRASRHCLCPRTESGMDKELH